MTEPMDATPSGHDPDAGVPPVAPPAASYVSTQWTTERPSPNPDGLTAEEQKHQRETSLVMSIVVIAAVVLGAAPLLYIFLMALFFPGGALIWFVAPILLTVLAATALRRAKRGGRRGPRVTARWALGAAIATFGLPLIVLAEFNAAMR